MKKPLPKITCPHCRKLFQPKRRDAIFCCANCRYANRWAKLTGEKK